MIENIKYHKMNGAGNEFIIIDNSDINFTYTPDIVCQYVPIPPKRIVISLLQLKKELGIASI